MCRGKIGCLVRVGSYKYILLGKSLGIYGRVKAWVEIKGAFFVNAYSGGFFLGGCDSNFRC